jgi:hypothetical protein
MRVPTPVNTVPLQQKRYSPVVALNSTTLAGLLSSCRQPLNIVTVKLQVAVLPDVSVAVQVTVVVPTGRTEPLGGVHTEVTPGQLSDTVGAGKVTVALLEIGQVCAATAVTFAGQVIVGGCVSLTVIVNEQLAVLPEASLTLHVTVVVPAGKNTPLAGEQTGTPTPGQLSETVGAG